MESRIFQSVWLRLALPLFLILFLEFITHGSRGAHLSRLNSLTPVAGKWHSLTPEVAARYQERLEREEPELQAKFTQHGTAPHRENTWEAARPYLLWMLETWIEKYGIDTAAPLGTDNFDPEWHIIPHNPSATTWCVFGGHGAVVGTREIEKKRENVRKNEGEKIYGSSKEELCDLHTMSLKSAGTHDMMEWGQTMEHLMDPWLGLAIIAVHLRPRGWHVTTAPVHNIPHGEPYHFFQPTPAGLALMCEGAGMPVLEIGYYGSALFNKLAHLMSFTGTGVPGNQLKDRYWPGEDASGMEPGKVNMNLKGAAQVIVLSRKTSGGGGPRGAPQVPEEAIKALLAARPPILSASEVANLFQVHVVDNFGWKPSSAVRTLLNTKLATLSRCSTLGVGEFVAVGGLVEGLAMAYPPAGGAWWGSHDENGQESCFCAAARSILRSGGEAAPACQSLPPPAQLRAGSDGGSSLIIMADVLEYVEDPILYVCSAVQALRPGGMIWLSARAVAPRDPYAGGRIMLRSITPTALLVTLKRCGAEVVKGGHWGASFALAQWVENEDASFQKVLGVSDVPPAEWVYAIQGWALGRKAG